MARLRARCEQQRFDVTCPYCGLTRTVGYSAYRKAIVGRREGYCGSACWAKHRAGRPDEHEGGMSDDEIRAWAVDTVADMGARRLRTIRMGGIE